MFVIICTIDRTSHLLVIFFVNFESPNRLKLCHEN